MRVRTCVENAVGPGGSVARAVLRELIGIGENWYAEIADRLDHAKAAILLITPAFLGSKFCHHEEVPVLLQRARRGDPQFSLANCSFSATGDNPYFPLQPGHLLVLRGEEDGELVEVIWEVLEETKELSLEIEGALVTLDAAIVREIETADGELTEISLNYFAHCVETGSVFYFGEDVDDYEEGEIVGHEGAWIAGENGAQPGVIMPGAFVVGDVYSQEIAPGIAEDLAVNVASGLVVSVAAGEFEGAVSVEEIDPLSPDDDPSVKIYAPGIGLIVDDSLELVDFAFPSDEPPSYVILERDVRVFLRHLGERLFLEGAPTPYGPWTRISVAQKGRRGRKATLVRDALEPRFFRLRRP